MKGNTTAMGRKCVKGHKHLTKKIKLKTVCLIFLDFKFLKKLSLTINFYLKCHFTKKQIPENYIKIEVEDVFIFNKTVLKYTYFIPETVLHNYLFGRKYRVQFKSIVKTSNSFLTQFITQCKRKQN